jgi:hypothetical protein
MVASCGKLWIAAARGVTSIRERGELETRSSAMTTFPEEAKNFRLLGHDPNAAWGCGSLVQVHKGFAYVGSVGTSSGHAPEGFTVHDVRDPRKPRKVAEVKSPPGVHSHKLRVVDGDILYVNSERLGGEAGRNARTGLFIFDISKGGEPRQIGFYDTPGTGPHRFGAGTAA